MSSLAKIKCPKCGFEDEGKFCSNCGSALSQSNVLSTAAIPPEGSWLDKCPVCKSGKLTSVSKKKLFGLSKEEKVECINCKASFSKKDNKYQLSYVTDGSIPLWQDYGTQILEEREWKAIAYGGLSDEKQKEADMDAWLTRFKNGEIPQLSQESPVMLKKGENLIISMPNISLLEARAVRKGGYSGSNIRVAKGLYFKVGGFQAQTHEELKVLDQGIITLTNKRIVYSGSKKTINIPLTKIISLEPYSDAISIVREGKEKTQHFKGINQGELTISGNGREYHEQFSGLMFMYMIQGLTKLED